MLEDTELYAVITGDIIGSSEMGYRGRDELISYLRDSFSFINTEIVLPDNFLMPVTIYRGDSFQAVIRQPAHALLVSVLLSIRLALFRKDLKGPAARISIGIGTIGYMPDSDNVGEADGIAFRLSGKALDDMKERDQQLLVSTVDPVMNLMLESMCSFFDNIAERWTFVQKGILLEKLSGSTQEEIASKHGKSQSAVSQSLKAAGFEPVKKFLDNYEQLFEYPDLFRSYS